MYSHLNKLKQLEGEKSSINEIHKDLCNFKNRDWEKISSLITALYEIAESEREEDERGNRGIHKDAYPENAEWARSFFLNPSPTNSDDDKVEHEYFLNLLYSLSFTLFLAKKNYEKFFKNSDHLSKLEYFLNTAENLYIALDTLAVLIHLTCGLKIKDKNQKIDRYFSKVKGKLRKSPYEKYFNQIINKLDINDSSKNKNSPPINMLNKIRNIRAHTPFLDWHEFKIVSKSENLSKVRSVCDRNNLFDEDKDINTFIDECFGEVTEILKYSLEGVFETYKNRLITDEASQPHSEWEIILA